MHVCGTKQVLKALAEGRAKSVTIARDADAPIRRKIEEAAANANVSPDYADSMALLGKQAGIAVGTAAVAETKN